VVSTARYSMDHGMVQGHNDCNGWSAAGSTEEEEGEEESGSDGRFIGARSIYCLMAGRS